MAQHGRYWSCTPFADWVRGKKKPGAGTREEWSVWKKEAVSYSPVRYWLAEKGLHKLQDFVTYPSRKIDDVRIYIRNRYVSNTHALTSTLKRGAWHEFDRRLLHSMFDSLVDFVEIEEAWSHIAWSEEAKKKYKVSKWVRYINWRCAEAGVDHLKWAASLVHDESSGTDPSEPIYGKPTGQAVAAIESLALYLWWKERVNRPDPYDACGWTAFCNRSPQSDEIFPDLSAGDHAETTRILEAVRAMEEAHTNEDTDMMIRLIKIRQSLWT